MATHSPGPWEVLDGVVVSAPLDSVRMVTLKDETEPREHHTGMVAIVYGHHVGESGARHYTADDNLRLVAAAPEMLAALYEVAHHADDECGFMVNVREAIAKAEGRA